VFPQIHRPITMANSTLGGACASCDKIIEYDGSTDDCLMCQGYCRRTFHIDCLSIGKTVLKTFRSNKHFLFFCEHCRILQKDFIARRNFVEAERSVANLVEILQTATQDVDTMCRNAIASIHTAEVTSKKKRSTKKKPAAVAATSSPQAEPSVVNLVDSFDADSEPHNDEFSTPKAPPENRNIRKSGFYGTCDTVDHIGVVEERRYFVITRIDPTTTSENILRHIHEKTGINDVKCQLLLPRGKEVTDLEFISFKLGVKEKDYQTLMTPAVWPSKILVRDFEMRRRSRRPNTARVAKF
jgi:hypothetical protein